MSKLKGLMDFFVTFEEVPHDDIPADAASDDVEVAARAARAHAESGSVATGGGGKRLSDYVDDPYAGSLDETMLSGPPDLDSENPFDDVYRAAGLSAAGDSAFTIYKVERLLQSQHLSGLGDKAKAASVLVALEANSVGLTSVIQDAVARDKALDNYDLMLRHDIKNLDADVQSKNAGIEAEIEEFLNRKREEIAANNAQLSEAKEMYARWSMRKQQEEDRLFRAVSPFVEQNPITRQE